MDYQSIVDEIRSFVQSVDQTLTDRIKDVAGLYAQACNEVNQRLRRCEEFLRKGLRSEAVHLAQTDPVLLDQLAILDFAERPQWDELALMYGLPAAPQLRLETAAALNEAYADEQPLEELLRKHRLLALTRGSLKGRLSILRRIAELDPESLVWPEDIRKFEKHRFQQIQHDLSALTGQEDYEDLAAISSELQSPLWLSAPPSNLVKQIEGAKDRLRKGWVSGRLRNLEGQLNDAINVFDLQRARQLREEWSLIARDAELAEGDPIMERAVLAFKWLKDQEVREANDYAFQDNLDELENALDNRAERAVLDRAFHSAKQFGREIPAGLEGRYQRRIAEEENTRSRKRKLAAGGIVAGSVLVLALISFWAYQSHQTNKLENAADSLEKMLDGEQISEARSFLDNLSEKENHTANHPRIVALKTKLMALEQKERDRVRRFQLALQEAEAEPPDAVKSPAVEKAESLAKKPREWDALAKLEDKRRDLIQQAKMHSKEAFDDRINELTKQVRKLEELPSSSRSALAAKNLLSKLQVAITQLRPESHKFGKSSFEQTEALATRLESVRLSMERNQQQLDLEYKLTATLAQPQEFDNYVAALQAYQREFPNTKRSADFELAAKEKSLWKGILRWSEIASTLANGPFDLEPEDVKTKSETCRTFLKQNANFVDADLVEVCLKCLGAVGQRDERIQGSAARDLRNIFEDFLIKDVWIIKTKDNKTYYSAKKVQKEDPVSFRKLVDLQGKDEVKVLTEKNVEVIDRAPQSVLAEKVRKLLPPGSRETLWIETTKKIAQMVLDDSETDPILKLVLFKKTIGYAARGSYPLALALAEQRNQLEKAGVNLEAPWMNPDDPDANETRLKAVQTLTKLPSLESVPKNAQVEQQKIRRRIRESKRMLIGWLARGDAGWECRTSTSAPDGEIALFVLMRDDSAKPVWKRIGTLTAGKWTINPDSPNALLEGRLIFGQNVETP